MITPLSTRDVRVRPGYSRPLTLAARKLGRRVVGAILQADQRERPQRPRLPPRDAGKQRWKLHVCDRAEHRQQVVELEDEAHPADLDSTNADEIISLMRRLNQEHGITFAIVTHDMGVGRKADRIVRMMDGQIVEEVYPAG